MSKVQTDEYINWQNEQDIIAETQRSVREKELKESKAFDSDIKFLKNMNIIHIIIEGLLFLVSYILYERMKYV